MSCTNYLPRMQYQNPVLSGDHWGWVNCTAYAAAMAADFDTCGVKHPTGARVRAFTDEPIPGASPGLNLRQVDDALRDLGVDLDTRYGISWDVLQRRIEAGQGAVLQLSTGPFLGTRYRSTATAIGHAIFVPPGWGAMDPAADGRRMGIHRYDGKPYPPSLLRKAAGALDLGYRKVGIGFAYAAFTRDRRTTWRVSVHRVKGRKHFWSYRVAVGTIIGRREDITRGFSATCTPPRLYPWPGNVSRSLVRLTDGSRAGDYIDSRYAEEIP